MSADERDGQGETDRRGRRGRHLRRRALSGGRTCWWPVIRDTKSDCHIRPLPLLSCSSSSSSSMSAPESDALRAQIFQRLHPHAYLDRFLAEGFRPDGREPREWRDVFVNVGVSHFLRLINVRCTHAVPSIAWLLAFCDRVSADAWSSSQDPSPQLTARHSFGWARPSSYVASRQKSQNQNWTRLISDS